MGWFRVLIETWWWVLLGALVGLAVGWALGRLLRPRDVLTHPHFTALKGEFDDQRAELRARDARIDELERSVAGLQAERSSLAARLDACEAARAELAAPAVLAAVTSGDAPASDETVAVTDAEPEPVPFDGAAAAAAYGAKVVLDDLKIVEGIGPKIEELLHAAGIRSWRELAAAPVDTVRDVLRGGGDRFRMHDPATWGEQAGLAATGAFAELKALQERLTAGRS